MKNLHMMTMHYPLDDEKLSTLQDAAKPTLMLHHDKEMWDSQKLAYETDYPDNIANLNPHFCEWTTIYCVWKNMLDDLSDDDTIQHSHYRKFLQAGNADQAVSLPLRYPNFRNNQTNTFVCHPRPSWELMQHAILDGHSFKEALAWSEWRLMEQMPAPRCLFKLKKPLFIELCEWVFPKLFWIEDRIPYSGKEYMTQYQRRAIAFIGERLFSYWCCSRHPELLDSAVPMIQLAGLKPLADEEERRLPL